MYKPDLIMNQTKITKSNDSKSWIMIKYLVIVRTNIYSPAHKVKWHGFVYVLVSVCVQQNYSDSTERLWEEVTIIVCVWPILSSAPTSRLHSVCFTGHSLGCYQRHHIHCVTLTQTQPSVHLNISLSTSILVSLFNSHVVSPFTHTLSLSPWPKPALLL